MADVLTPEDLNRIRENQEKIRLAKEQIKLAEQAGLDVTALKQRAQEQEQQLTQIRQTYFPGK